MNKERLLNVAKACRESPHPEKFTMSRHMHPCGTPACAFGHYAARQDLQDAFKLLNPKYFIRSDGEVHIADCDGVATIDGREAAFDTDVVADHFEICDEEQDELFGSQGCGNAKSAIEAAEYIERFVERNS